MQRRALDIFEHEVARPDVVELTDVGMVQRGDRPRFVLESTQTIGISGEPFRKDLDRHVAPEAGVARAIDLAHAARAERGEDLVRTEAFAGSERHEEFPMNRCR